MKTQTREKRARLAHLQRGHIHEHKSTLGKTPADPVRPRCCLRHRQVHPPTLPSTRAVLSSKSWARKPSPSRNRLPPGRILSTTHSADIPHHKPPSSVPTSEFSKRVKMSSQSFLNRCNSETLSSKHVLSTASVRYWMRLSRARRSRRTTRSDVVSSCNVSSTDGAVGIVSPRSVATVPLRRLISPSKTSISVLIRTSCFCRLANSCWKMACTFRTSKRRDTACWDAAWYFCLAWRSASLRAMIFCLSTSIYCCLRSTYGRASDSAMKCERSSASGVLTGVSFRSCGSCCRKVCSMSAMKRPGNQGYGGAHTGSMRGHSGRDSAIARKTVLQRACGIVSGTRFS